jgi:hypothetical protein
MTTNRGAEPATYMPIFPTEFFVLTSISTKWWLEGNRRRDDCTPIIAQEKRL